MSFEYIEYTSDRTVIWSNGFKSIPPNTPAVSTDLDGNKLGMHVGAIQCGIGDGDITTKPLSPFGESYTEVYTPASGNIRHTALRLEVGDAATGANAGRLIFFIQIAPNPTHLGKYYSDDGVSWGVIGPNFAIPTGFSSNRYGCMQMTVNDPAGNNQGRLLLYNGVNSSSKLWYSDDSGLTLTSYNIGSSNSRPFSYPHIVQMTVGDKANGANAGRLFMFNDTIEKTTIGYSDNSGAFWFDINLPASDQVYGITQVTSGPNAGRLFMGTKSSLFYSDDSFATFVSIPIPTEGGPLVWAGGTFNSIVMVPNYYSANHQTLVFADGGTSYVERGEVESPAIRCSSYKQIGYIESSNLFYVASYVFTNVYTSDDQCRNWAIGLNTTSNRFGELIVHNGDIYTYNYNMLLAPRIYRTEAGESLNYNNVSLSVNDWGLGSGLKGKIIFQDNNVNRVWKYNQQSYMGGIVYFLLKPGNGLQPTFGSSSSNLAQITLNDTNNVPIILEFKPGIFLVRISVNYGQYVHVKKLTSNNNVSFEISGVVSAVYGDSSVVATNTKIAYISRYCGVNSLVSPSLKRKNIEPSDFLSVYMEFRHFSQLHATSPRRAAVIIGGAANNSSVQILYDAFNIRVSLINLPLDFNSDLAYTISSGIQKLGIVINKVAGSVTIFKNGTQIYHVSGVDMSDFVPASLEFFPYQYQAIFDMYFKKLGVSYTDLSDELSTLTQI